MLPSQQIKGFITTQGITKLALATGAKEGNAVDTVIGPSVSPSSFGSDWYIFAILGFATLVGIALISLAIQHISRADSDFSAGMENFPLLVMLVLIGCSPIGFSLSDLFYGFMVYFLITRFKLINGTLKRMVSPNPEMKEETQEMPPT